VKVLKTNDFIAERVKIKPVTNAEWEDVKKEHVHSYNKKYEITNKTIEYDSHILHQIKALEDMQISERITINAGSFGGWVESENNLSHEGRCWVDDNAKVYSNATVYGNAYVCGDAIVRGNAKIYDDARVSGYAHIIKNAEIYGNAEVRGNACIHGCVCGDAVVSGTAGVWSGRVMSTGKIDKGVLT